MDSCPQCGSAETTMTVRQAFEDRDGSLGGPPAWEVAPPPVPEAKSTHSSGGIALIVIGGLLFVKALFKSIAPHPELDEYTDAYVAGTIMGAFFLAAIPLTIGVLLQQRARSKRLDKRVLERWEQQTAVWGQARLCRTCKAAFWPAGSIRSEFPASPLIPIEQFPLMVVTMAERANQPLSLAKSA